MASFLGTQLHQDRGGKTFLLPVLCHLSPKHGKGMRDNSPWNTWILSSLQWTRHASSYACPRVVPSHNDCCADHVTSFGQWHKIKTLMRIEGYSLSYCFWNPATMSRSLDEVPGDMWPRWRQPSINDWTCESHHLSQPAPVKQPGVTQIAYLQNCAQ